MSSCHDVQGLLVETALEVAPARERAAVLAHVEHCPPCSHALAQAADTADLLLALIPPSPPTPALRDRILATARAPTIEPAPAAPRLRRRRTAALAGLALVLATAGAASTYPWTRPAPPAGQTRTVALHDTTGQDVGLAVFSAGPRPSLVLSFMARGPGRAFRVVILDDRARTVSLGTAQSADGICTFRHALPLAATEIHRLEMIDPDQSVAYSADL